MVSSRYGQHFRSVHSRFRRKLSNTYGTYNNYRKFTPKVYKRKGKSMRPMRNKRRGSQTAAPVKKFLRTEDASNLHSGVATNVIRVRSGFKKNRAKTLGRWVYHSVRQGYLASVAGRQFTDDIQHLGTPAQLTSPTNASLTPFSNDIGLSELNPNFNNTGSDLLTIKSPPNDKFIWSGCQMEMEMTNFSSVAAFVDLYLVRARKNLIQSPFNAWNTGYINAAYGQSANVQPAAGSVTGVTGGYEGNFMVGTKPTDSKIFQESYKVMAIKHLELSGGSTEKVVFDIFADKLIQRDIQTAYIANSTPFIANQTYSLMAVIRGSLVNDVTTGTGIAEFVTYGETKVGYVLNIHWFAKGVKNAAARLDTGRAYVQIPFGALKTNQTHILSTDASAAIVENP